MKNSIKVIIMVSSPLTERWENYFCIDALAKAFDVEYWDMAHVATVYFEAKNVITRNYVKTIDSLESLKVNLRRLPKDVVCLSHIHLDVVQNYKLHKVISSYCKNRVGVNFWSSAYTENIDFANEDINEKQTEIVQTSKRGFFKLIKSILYKVYPIKYTLKFLRHRNDGEFQNWKKRVGLQKVWPMYTHYTINLMPGSEYFINHPDYDKYIQISRKKAPALVDGKYIVYIDQYFLHHPTLINANPHLNFEQLRKHFYTSINSFFDKIEKALDCKVVIAAHPVADYRINPFRGRQIFYYKTAELISQCEAVCMHNSCSMSFVILYDKPVCLIVNKQHDAVPSMCDNTRKYSKNLHIPLTEIDKLDDVHNVFTKISPIVRNGFMRTFFDVNNKKTNAELFVENIERIHSDIINNQRE